MNFQTYTKSHMMSMIWLWWLCVIHKVIIVGGGICVVTVSIIVYLPGWWLHSHPSHHHVWSVNHLHHLLLPGSRLQGYHPCHRSGAGILNTKGQSWPSKWFKILGCHHLLFLRYAGSGCHCCFCTVWCECLCWCVDIFCPYRGVCFPWTHFYS